MNTPSLNDPELCKKLLERLVKELDGRSLRFMEVCGTHTVSIFRSGLRTLLPENVTHLTGPGCPVCVTHDAEVAEMVALSRMDNVLLATFGDLMRVPGPDGKSLKHAQAEGARVEVVYSPLDALTLCRENPDRMVVFPGVGFETTAPAVAATVLTAEAAGIENFAVLSCHKLVPPALDVLLADTDCAIDAFLLPGHVSTVLGLTPYAFVAETYARPAVVGGFAPADILDALIRMAVQLREHRPAVENAYPRAVHAEGNPKAREVMDRVFTVADARWRGLGVIPHSGLDMAPGYARFDARKRLDLPRAETRTIPGCRCGEILKGKLDPTGCPLFGKACTPATPVGPCMVSTEGSCAAFFRYGI